MARKRKKDPAVVGKEVASRPGPVAVVWTLDRVKSRCEVADECWVWTGKFAPGKTPMVAIDKRSVSVRKWVLEQRIGRPLARGQYARLTCGVEGCVSPHCVEVGKISARNREALGRKKHLLVRSPETRLRNRAHALSIGWGKLTLEIAREIRAAHASGAPVQSLASTHGVKTTTIHKLLAGKSWKEPGELAPAVNSSVFLWRPAA